MRHRDAQRCRGEPLLKGLVVELAHALAGRLDGLPHGLAGFVGDRRGQLPQDLEALQVGHLEVELLEVRTIPAAEPDGPLPFGERGGQGHRGPVANDLHRDVFVRVELRHRAHHVPGVLGGFAGDRGDHVTHFEASGSGRAVFGHA